MQYPRILEILHHRLNPTYRFKELTQVHKNPKILNPGNQSKHRWNKKWHWLLEILHHRLNPKYNFKDIPQVQKNPKILNPGNQSQHRWNKKGQCNILDYLKYFIIDYILHIDLKNYLKFRKIQKYLIQAINLNTDEIRSDNAISLITFNTSS